MDMTFIFLIIATVSLVVMALIAVFFVIAALYMRRRVQKLRKLASIRTVKRLVPVLLAVVPVEKVLDHVKPRVKQLRSRLHDLHLNLSSLNFL